MTYFQRIQGRQSKMQPPSSLPLEAISFRGQDRWINALLAYSNPDNDPDNLIENQVVDSHYVENIYLYGTGREST
jgi:hypothetical protein